MSNKNSFTCASCTSEYDVSEANEVNGYSYCNNCFDEFFVRCSYCDELIHIDDNDGNSETVLCGNCYTYYFTSCENCLRIIHTDDAHYLDDCDDPYCSTCYNEIIDRESSADIHDYSYKPSPIFYGDEGYFMGIELEVDCGGCYSDNAAGILEIANHTDEHIYIKRDGSIDDGFEIVTHPMSYYYHMNCMPWQSIMSKCVSLGYRSHQTSTCGLHIHIGRNSLGKDKPQQEETISRILYFTEKHWDEILKFSRRTQNQINRWARRYGYKNNPTEVLDYAKEAPNGRYSAINLLNTATIEFRLFRGTLKYKTFVATLQLVEEICKVSKSMSDEAMQDLSWQSFVSSITGKPELIEYLKLHSLYINEPYNDEEEDI
jgi:hypothetical protein